jgi:hypothetical protein
MECINEDLIEKKLKRRDDANRQRWKTNEKQRPYLKWEKPGKEELPLTCIFLITITRIYGLYNAQ